MTFRSSTRLAVSLIAALLCARASWAVDGKDKLEKLMKFYADHDHFNGTVLISRKGTNLLVKGYGYQDIEKKIPNTEKTVFQLGGVSMQFTAELMLLLDSQGRLGHGDKVSKYYKDFPNGSKIILKNLLTQTSGLYDYTSDPAIMSDVTKGIQLDTLVSIIKSKPLNFEPGERFQPTNTNYVVLGYIIEKLTRWGLEDQIRSKIFMPCGMTHSGFDFANLVNEYKATGYYEEGNGKLKKAPITDSSLTYGGGDIFSTVDDMYRWHRALSAYTLIPEDWQDVGFTPLKYNYASGWEINHLFQRRIEEQGGTVSGFSSYILRQPNDDILVVLLQNKMAPTEENKIMARNILKCLYDPNYKVPTTDNLAEEIAADKRAVAQEMREQDRLDSTKAALKKLEPVVEAPKKVEKIEPWVPLVGEYITDPTFSVNITHVGASLYAQPTNQEMSLLQPGDNPLIYRVNANKSIDFVKDEQGEVIKLIYHDNGRDKEAIKKIKH